MALAEQRAAGIVGRHLFEFVSEPELQQSYRALADRVISTGEPAVIAARCDSPGAVREVRLSIGRLPLRDNGPGLLFQARIVTRAARPPLDVFDLRALLSVLGQQGDLPIVTMCSFCQQLRRPESRDDVIGFSRRILSPRRREPVQISHGSAPMATRPFPDP